MITSTPDEGSVGITPAELAGQYPLLYHMAALGSWPSIQRHGLLSTSRLLDLFQVDENTRERIESQRRPNSVHISHHEYGSAVIRDQKPMDDAGLLRCLEDGLSPAEWYRILNRHVFFWVSEQRLRDLLRARAYRGSRHTVLVLDTAAVVGRHVEDVRLSPMNSGATKPMPFPRGLGTFRPLHEFPYERLRAQRRGRSPVVEVAVVGGVRDAAEFTTAVFEMGDFREDDLQWGVEPAGWTWGR